MRVRRDRLALPKPTDRLSLGSSGLRVSPICLGVTGSPASVKAAFEAGVNFFFLSADLHWPVYESTRKGLELLLKGNPRRREQIVVGMVSYLEEPWFGYFGQFWEGIRAVPGLGHADLLIAGGVSTVRRWDTRLPTLCVAKSEHFLGARASGASLHQRKLAVRVAKSRALDIAYIRYNAAHPGAAREVFPHLPRQSRTLLFNFRSVVRALPRVAGSQSRYKPEPTDHYRFVLSGFGLDGLLCSPQSPKEVRALVKALDKPPLSRDEQQQMLARCAGADRDRSWEEI